MLVAPAAGKLPSVLAADRLDVHANTWLAVISFEVSMRTPRLLGQDRDDTYHLILERLTTAKLEIGLLRRHLHQATALPAEAEAHLTHVEQELDRAAALTHDTRDRSRNE